MSEIRILKSIGIVKSYKEARSDANRHRNPVELGAFFLWIIISRCSGHRCYFSKLLT